MSRPHHLWISGELRQAITSLQTSFGSDFWFDYGERKMMLGDDDTRSKFQALVGAMYKILDGKGTGADFVTMREACVPTEWLVTFLDQWKVSEAQNGLGGTTEPSRLSLLRCQYQKRQSSEWT